MPVGAILFLVFIAVCAIIGLAGEAIWRALFPRREQPKREVFRYTDRGIKRVQ